MPHNEANKIGFQKVFKVKVHYEIQILFFDSKQLSFKAAFKGKKISYANFVLEIF